MKRAAQMLPVCLFLFCLLLFPGARAEDAPQAAIRGRTLVARLPEAWIETQLEGEPILEASGDDFFSWGGPSVWNYSGEAAEWMEAQLEGGLLVEYVGTGKVGTGMGARRIGENWYVAVRLRSAPEGSVRLSCNLSEVSCESGGGALRVTELRCAFAEPSVAPERLDGAPPELELESGGLRVGVYAALDAHVAVIVEANANENHLEGVQLMIGGAPGPLMDGYMDGSSAVFVCALSDDELAALEGGSGCTLRRDSAAEGVDFGGRAFAAAQDGTGGWGVVDEAGQWRVEPVYQRVSSPEPARSRWDSAPNFFCETADGELVVLDGETLAEIARLPGETLASYGNPAVFATYAQGGTRVYDARSGAALFSASGTLVSSGGALLDYVRPEYVGWVSGLPQRLVIQRGALGQPNVRCYLADNAGARVSGDYDFILPLAWSGSAGAFLTQTCPDGAYLEASSVEFQDFSYSGEGGWRCGLIDQDGRVIAETEFVSVELISATEARLSRADGTSEVFSLF